MPHARTTRHPSTSIRRVVGLAVLVGLVGTGARGVQIGAQTPAPPGGPDLLVLAAASLADVLPPIADRWSEGSGVRVTFSFDATSRIAPQAVAGARADLFVAADESWILWLEERDAVRPGAARVLATNELVLIVPRGEPPPEGPADLVNVTRLALGGENVPAGRYARQALMGTGSWEAVQDRIVTGGSVRGVLEWVARGEVSAGVVYRTDAFAEPRVEVAFAFSTNSHEPIRYWMAPLSSGPNPAAASGLLTFLESAEAGEMLAASGFVPPGPTTTPDEPPTVLGPGGEQTPAVQVAAPSDPSITSAIGLSLLVALLATVAGLVPAVGLGWLLARGDFRGKTLLSTAVLAPLVLPPVVTGFLLLTILGTQGTVGGLLAAMGLRIPFSVLGAAIAAFVVGLPLYVLAARGAFESVDRQYEELSWTLGAPPRRTFFRVSLPLALPGIAAGAVLAFARALGEFGATVVLAGNVEGSTRTIALAVYTLLESPSGRASIWVLVAASVGLALLALAGYEALSRRQRRRLEADHGR